MQQRDARQPLKPTDVPQGSWRLPLYAQIGIAIGVGVGLGLAFGTGPYLPGVEFGNAELSRLTMLLTTLLKTLAAPLIFFAVLDAMLRTAITGERCGKLLLFSLVNVTVAMCIGLFIMNVWKPGEAWSDRLADATRAASLSANPEATSASREGLANQSLTLVESLSRMVPTSVVAPFAEGNLMSLILMAILIGAGYRAVRKQQLLDGEAGYPEFAQVVSCTYQVLLQVLAWVVKLVPLAVCGAVAHSVAETGGEVFHLVGVFLASMCAGLAVHAFGYYTLVAWIYGQVSPRTFLGSTFEALVTGLSTNSSLATVPVTLRVLTDKIGVSDESARLSACVGTNFNNDGITLYEAMTAIFLAQAAGFGLPLVDQIKVVGICVLASLGAAGIPQGGLAVLPLVLTSTGLSPATIATAMPLIMTVDWIIARCRSGVNVMGDITVAIQLDRSRSPAGA